jgi:hypothetical protein
MAAVQPPGLGLVRLLPGQAPQVLQSPEAQKALQTQMLLQVH